MKFRGADKIIKRIAYLQKQNHKTYTVCYEDRFLGIIEADINWFITKSEVPFHRI